MVLASSSAARLPRKLILLIFINPAGDIGAAFCPGSHSPEAAGVGQMWGSYFSPSPYALLAHRCVESTPALFTAFPGMFKGHSSRTSHGTCTPPYQKHPLGKHHLQLSPLHVTNPMLPGQEGQQRRSDAHEHPSGRGLEAGEETQRSLEG